jgi:hypothetical protein
MKASRQIVGNSRVLFCSYNSLTLWGVARRRNFSSWHALLLLRRGVLTQTAIGESPNGERATEPATQPAASARFAARRRARWPGRPRHPEPAGSAASGRPGRSRRPARRPEQAGPGRPARRRRTLTLKSSGAVARPSDGPLLFCAKLLVARSDRCVFHAVGLCFGHGDCAAALPPLR